MPLPFFLAVLRGAQKWLREPASLNASVLRWAPLAAARRISGGPYASRTAVPQKCMHMTMAVDPHSCAIRVTMAAAPLGPRPSPPTSVELTAPIRPAAANAFNPRSGNAPRRSTSGASGAIVSLQTRSSAAEYSRDMLHLVAATEAKRRVREPTAAESVVARSLRAV